MKMFIGIKWLGTVGTGAFVDMECWMAIKFINFQLSGG